MKSWKTFNRKKILERGKTMDYKDNEITMTLRDFLTMRDYAIVGGELLDILFTDCELNSTDRSLLFNYPNLNGYLKYAAPDRYSRTIEELKSARDKE